MSVESLLDQCPPEEAALMIFPVASISAELGRFGIGDSVCIPSQEAAYTGSVEQNGTAERSEIVSGSRVQCQNLKNCDHPLCSCPS